MPTLDELRRGRTPFEPFLHAAVGEDRNGNTVTVLSTLARLGLEPLQAASDLAGLTRDEARSRLGGLLARFGDVPALGADNGAITRRLIDLLPGPSAGRVALPLQRALLPGAAMGIVPLLVLVLLALYLLSTLWSGPGAGGF